MDPNRFKRLRKNLQRQVSWGQYALLAVLAVSFLNQIMLWLGINYHFLVSAAMPYYINWMARQLSSGSFAVAATVVTLALYGAYGLCLLKSYEPQWFKAGMLLYAADTVLLLVFALALLENPVSCLLELIVHGAVLVLLWQAWRARQRLQRLAARMPEGQ